MFALSVIAERQKRPCFRRTGIGKRQENSTGLRPRTNVRAQRDGRASKTPMLPPNRDRRTTRKFHGAKAPYECSRLGVRWDLIFYRVARAIHRGSNPGSRPEPYFLQVAGARATSSQTGSGRGSSRGAYFLQATGAPVQADQPGSMSDPPRLPRF